MARAIITKFICPTNTKPARIKATGAFGSITVGYHSVPDDKQGCEERNRWAAEQLINKVNKDRGLDLGIWYLTEPDGLCMPDGTGYAFGACIG